MLRFLEFLQRCSCATTPLIWFPTISKLTFELMLQCFQIKINKSSDESLRKSCALSQTLRNKQPKQSQCAPTSESVKLNAYHPDDSPFINQMTHLLQTPDPFCSNIWLISHMGDSFGLSTQELVNQNKFQFIDMFIKGLSWQSATRSCREALLS